MKNHILLVLDAVRYDVFDEEKFENLPNNSLKAYSPAVWTLPSFFSYLHGYSPSGAELWDFDKGQQCAWLPNELKNNGYYTAFHTGSAWMAIPDKKEVFSRGFDEYDVELEKDRMDEFANQQYAKYEPFFHLYHVLEPHHPTYDGEETVEFEKDARKENLRGMRGALHYVDEKFGKMVERLPDGTVVTVTADHADAQGEGEPESWGHNPNSARMEGFQIRSMPEELTAIPYSRGVVRGNDVEWEDPENLKIDDYDPRERR